MNYLQNLSITHADTVDPVVTHLILIIGVIPLLHI